jgi:hypothetical protein
LQAALGRVSQQINVNSTAVKTLDGRVRGAVAEQARLSAAMRKETADRKKEMAGIRRDLQSTREMIALISLLFPSGGGAGTAASLAPLVFLLPPDFLGGLTGGNTSSDGTQSSSMLGGGNGAIALIAVAAAAGLLQ